MNVRLIAVTPKAEELVAYCARVSNPDNQHNPQVARLLGFCIRHGHWSIFEMANMVVEITTTRAIAAQLLRHRSFSFQEFSQRYAPALGFEPAAARRQDVRNRQHSIDDLDQATKTWYATALETVQTQSQHLYAEALQRGIAKECARFLLPLSTTTRLYMNGTLRSWIHYLQLRTDSATQQEHRDLAEACKDVFCQQFPCTATALKWKEPDV